VSGGPFDLAGKRALVTGASGAIGGAAAHALAQAGARVALNGRSDTLEEAAAGVGGIAVRGDLGDRDGLVAAFDEAVERLGGLDILVTSHGTVTPGPSVDQRLTDWDRDLELNLTSVFSLCQLAGRVMLAQGSGKIVTIASVLSFSGGLMVPAYAASKGGVAQLTKALANEWAAQGVNVNAIAPGYVKTAFNAHVWGDERRSEKILDRVPIGRWGRPEDLGGAVVFLASPASDFVHGVVLPVDGGWMSR
jgi:2-deoxy-D-gluconate 3-dehydrogenase